MNWKDILFKYTYTNNYPKGEEITELKKTETILEMYEGDEVLPRGKAIRAFCMDCAGGSNGEVLLCHSFSCPLYPYRIGTNTRYRSERAGIDRTLYSGGNNYQIRRKDGTTGLESPPTGGFKGK